MLPPSAGSATSTAGSPGDTHEVVYKVTTTGKVTIAFANAAGESRQETSSDWTKTVTVGRFDFATLSVANADPVTSVQLACEILVDGVSKSRNDASGRAAVASCSVTTLD